ncbi:hypothetical protein GCM10027167_62570 [Nocardia heshunensis]
MGVSKRKCDTEFQLTRSELRVRCGEFTAMETPVTDSRKPGVGATESEAGLSKVESIDSQRQSATEGTGPQGVQDAGKGSRAGVQQAIESSGTGVDDNGDHEITSSSIRVELLDMKRIGRVSGLVTGINAM